MLVCLDVLLSHAFFVGLVHPVDESSLYISASQNCRLLLSRNLTVWLSPGTNFTAGVKCAERIMLLLLDENRIICPPSPNSRYITVQKFATTSTYLNLYELKIHTGGA